jgi:predicted transcriptional regulator of viral defense system
MQNASSQEDKIVSLLSQRGMARLSEFTKNGITYDAVLRMKRMGRIAQLSRGLYQLSNARLDANHFLAQAAKRVPKGVICLFSALAYHELTDRIPRRIWVATGPRDWRPKITDAPIEIVRFGPIVYRAGIETHVIERVPVRIYSPAKTIVDILHYSSRQRHHGCGNADFHEALQAMKEVLRARMAMRSEIIHYAHQARIWHLVRLYLGRT